MMNGSAGSFVTAAVVVVVWPPLVCSCELFQGSAGVYEFIDEF